MRKPSTKYMLPFAFLGALLTLLAGCISFHPPGVDKNSEAGLASWYGRDFHGRPTASGERYDMYRLTAAHKTAPLKTYAVVTNLDNGRKVKVRINDRGPFVRGRVIDLSYAAAKKIDMVGTGTARVKVSFLSEFDPEDRPKEPIYFLQVASFLERENAEGLKRELGGDFAGLSVQPANAKGDIWYRVCVGPLSDDDKIQSTKERLEGKGYQPFATLGQCGY